MNHETAMRFTPQSKVTNIIRIIVGTAIVLILLAVLFPGVIFRTALSVYDGGWTAAAELNQFFSRFGIDAAEYERNANRDYVSSIA